jgi:hypothetical protein
METFSPSSSSSNFLQMLLCSSAITITRIMFTETPVFFLLRRKPSSFLHRETCWKSPPVCLPPIGSPLPLRWKQKTFGNSNYPRGRSVENWNVKASGANQPLTSDWLNLTRACKSCWLMRGKAGARQTGRARAGGRPAQPAFQGLYLHAHLISGPLFLAFGWTPLIFLVSAKVHERLHNGLLAKRRGDAWMC